MRLSPLSSSSEAAGAEGCPPLGLTLESLEVAVEMGKHAATLALRNRHLVLQSNANTAAEQAQALAAFYDWQNAAAIEHGQHPRYPAVADRARAEIEIQINMAEDDLWLEQLEEDDY